MSDPLALFLHSPSLSLFCYSPVNQSFVARNSSVRVLLALASIHKMIVYQMDVTTAFLNDDLEKEIYMQQRERRICSQKMRKQGGILIKSYTECAPPIRLIVAICVK